MYVSCCHDEPHFTSGWIFVFPSHLCFLSPLLSLRGYRNDVLVCYLPSRYYCCPFWWVRTNLGTLWTTLDHYIKICQSIRITSGKFLLPLPLFISMNIPMTITFSLNINVAVVVLKYGNPLLHFHHILRASSMNF